MISNEMNPYQMKSKNMKNKHQFQLIKYSTVSAFFLLRTSQAAFDLKELIPLISWFVVDQKLPLCFSGITTIDLHSTRIDFYTSMIKVSRIFEASENQSLVPVQFRCTHYVFVKSVTNLRGKHLNHSKWYCS